MKLMNILFLLTPALVHADFVTTIPEVGPHHTFLVVEKSINPQNIVMVYTKMDEKCRFLTDRDQRDQPIFDFYWLMDRSKYKPVNPLIKNEFRGRMEMQQVVGNGGAYYIKMNDLKEMDHDLPDARMLVQSRLGASGACDVDGRITLGPSAGNATIIVSKIYTEAKGGFPLPKLVAVTVTGRDLKTGKELSQTYRASAKKSKE